MAKILVGVSSSISAYKVCDLIRDLWRAKHQARVILTPFAERFVGRLTFDTLTGQKTYTTWEDDPLLHISLARWADVFLIAPCSANTLSKIATGIADNLLTTTVLAYERPLLIAPAANVQMYKNPIIQEHIQRLKSLGHIIIEPEEDILACLEEGQGKLASKERILDWIEYALRDKPLKGKKVLITCGATREFIDSVRFISNSSSGEMGFSLAKVFRWYGAQVKVIAGFTTVQEPPEVELHRVVSAQDMYQKVMELLPWSDIVVMNAAVSDYKPKEFYQGKMKKRETLTLELVKNVDILEELGKVKENKILVGFALEEEEKMIPMGMEKLKRKNLDMIVVNPIQTIGSKSHKGFIIKRDATIIEIREQSKISSAEEIVKTVCNLL